MTTSSAAPFFVVAGATACGKSEIAVQIAERCGGEVVGGDAFQIYRGLDLLTAKPGPELRSRVPHHLIGEVPLEQSFDVAQYLALARARIAQIHERGKLAIVCGGTGLYVRALLRGLADLPGADPSVRAELEAHSAEERERRLTELDPVSVAQIDLHNPRRVIRALEVCLLTGRPFSSFREEWASLDLSPRGVVLERDLGDLRRGIADRTAAMFAGGVEEEVRSVSEIGETAVRAIGFREIQALLTGKSTRGECLEAVAKATRQYAKRQATWFRREAGLIPVGIPPEGDVEAFVGKLAQQATSNAHC